MYSKAALEAGRTQREAMAKESEEIWRKHEAQEDQKSEAENARLKSLCTEASSKLSLFQKDWGKNGRRRNEHHDQLQRLGKKFCEEVPPITSVSAICRNLRVTLSS